MIKENYEEESNSSQTNRIMFTQKEKFDNSSKKRENNNVNKFDNLNIKQKLSMEFKDKNDQEINQTMIDEEISQNENENLSMSIFKNIKQNYTNYECIIKSNKISQKYWFGNPLIDVIEEEFFGVEHVINNCNINYSQVWLSNKTIEKYKNYLWSRNINNSLLSSSIICCCLHNKVTLVEFLSIVKTMLSSVLSLNIWKSSFPNYYFIKLEFINSEYSNVFYNTFSYTKISILEDDYLMFYEIQDIKGEVVEKEKIPNFKKRNYIEEEIENVDIQTCSICLELMNFSYKHSEEIRGVITALCGHLFHIECLMKTDSCVCPLCRFNISPYTVTTCKYCSAEKDLWICLICGLIHCGADTEKGSSNHRNDHFLGTNHQHCKSIDFEKRGDNSETFDFVLGKSLESIIKNKNKSNKIEEEFTPNPEYLNSIDEIVIEFNSIISSQLEFQRNFYMKQIKNQEQENLDEIEKNYKLKNQTEEENRNLKNQIELLNEEKISCYNSLSSKNEVLKSLLLEKEQLNKEYLDLEKEKMELKNKEQLGVKRLKLEFDTLNDEISQIKENINELKMNLNINKKLKNSGGKITGITNSGKGNKK